MRTPIENYLGIPEEAFYDVDHLPPDFLFELYRKKALTPAVRITRPFAVQTGEGLVRCEDGWLAMDSRGYPYPIAADEFDAIYEPAD